jgi:hypothetical protein
MATSTRRAALYVWVSTSDRGQTRREPANNRSRRPTARVEHRGDLSIATSASAVPGGATSGLDWMFCSRASPGAEFDMVAAWSVCRLCRLLSDLIGCWASFDPAI